MIRHISVNEQSFKLNTVLFDISKNFKDATTPRKELQYPIFYGKKSRVISTNGNILVSTRVKLDTEETGIGLIVDDEVIFDDAKLRAALLKDYDKALEEKIYEKALKLIKQYKEKEFSIKYSDINTKFYVLNREEKNSKNIVELQFDDTNKTYIQKVFFDYLLPFFKDLSDVEVYYDKEPLRTPIYFKLKHKVLIIMPIYVENIELEEIKMEKSIFG